MIAEHAHLSRGTPAYRRATFALFCAGFATFALLYCIQPLLPMLAAHFSVSAASSSLALSLTTLSLAVCLLISGALAESWGRKPVMAAALGLASLLGLASVLVDSWQLLLALRALLGLALSGLPALAMAYVGEEFEPESLPAAMGLYIGGTALGGMLGRLLSGLLSDLGGWQLALGGIASLGLLALVAFVWLLPPSRHFTAQPLSLRILLTNFRLHLGNPVLRGLFLQGFLLMGGFVALFNYIGFRLAGEPFGLSSTLIGLLFVVYLGGIFSAGWAGRLVPRFGARQVLRGGVALMLIGVGLCATSWLVSIVLGLGLFTLGFFAAHAVASGQVGSHAKGARAQASALYLCAYYLGSSVVGYGAGYVWDHAGWLPLMALLAALFVIAGWRARAL
ncbi:MFS transporter [Pseudomonas sp. NP21570]|jgi:YNFM family putative membrane transporter|uniref:MFS family transporter n=1 Tax=Stutzerimonas stutzeri CCUG 29243 TaxID=1196835 RepID=I4CRF2_STUST|nr:MULTISPECIES: MFS transporter [Stutzerimonas stutzeri subgroup]MAK87298.1 MFS transporter [Pseudomonas sp.]MBU0836465.1 MFS transporter [Gammaproteobacteria bacterium]MCB4793067.1 MFS transporter [Pseudomonas sp. NP21570]RRU72752.1 MFS transporter [Stutzerimonas xanthomarina]AFM32659.1 MFS family transporter [Stutzerimonas stutzeri CCUG 29243]|tara:strand:- start:268 stop:1446 length:1179 start_codon:yes stop_codon:yes gene_type:complete